MGDVPVNPDIKAGSPEAYAAAHRVLAEAKAEALEQYAAESRKRKRTAGIVAVVWLAICVALVFGVGPDMLVIAVIGFAAVVAFAVFYLMPSIMGAGELEELFGQYAAQVEALEQAGAALPVCASMEELVPAIDYVSSPGE